MTAPLRPAAQAFDAIAPVFDSRFNQWRSVTAQRRAVRNLLVEAFPSGGRIFELGGGTGEDAAFLAHRGFDVLLTDPSPTMVQLANTKLAPLGASAEVAAGEDMEAFAAAHRSSGSALFDGAFSNFAPLNCVVDLSPVARGLARLLKPGAPAMLVLFGTFCPGEMLVEVLRGRPQLALRRCRRNEVPARLAKREFQVVYHRRAAIVSAFAPWFVLEKSVGIGVTVPPSSAEPWISHHPRALAGMEALDRILAGPLAMLGDHVLYQFRRTSVS
ncbi:class I SAM-dependent methyltransferase [Acidicapsa acidisoli]|uniref:class I SAM-dependent methyltransferase n=1 Tax=Acidicapsa acidisoli TaxID=1615681 RepID=UPI0021DFE80B|nr:class I SAM-dependent methyltransferase [Acidicapsa acidisoli]